MTVEQKAIDIIRNHSHRLIENFTQEDLENREISIFFAGYHECEKEHEWHLTKNELPELQTDSEYSAPVLCFWYHINSHGKKIKVYDLDRWNSENDIWEISGMKKDQIEAWMYLPEPPEENK
jgi:hypothetical protein